MEADAARRMLLAQHDQLREHLNHCSVLARRVLEGEPVHVELEAALGKLRHALMEHNATETNLVRPLLRGSTRWGALLVDRMLEEHVAEHAAFWDMLTGSPADVASRMNDLVDELDAHMAAEERTFLSPLVLHDDVIQRRRQAPA
jgi:iron-sulfur cluster repair protein YtfE (RIC family)